MIGRVACVLLLTLCYHISTSEAVTRCPPDIICRTKPISGSRYRETVFGVVDDCIDIRAEEGYNLTFQFFPNTSISRKECDPNSGKDEKMAMVYIQLYGDNHPYCEDRFTLYPLISDNHIRVTHCYTEHSFKATISKKLAGTLYAGPQEEFRVVKANTYVEQWIRIRHHEKGGELKFSLEDIRYTVDDCQRSFIRIERISDTEEAQEIKMGCASAQKDLKLEYTLQTKSVNISFLNVAFNLRHQVVGVTTTSMTQQPRFIPTTGDGKAEKEKDSIRTETEQGMPLLHIVLFAAGGVVFVIVVLVIVICCAKCRKSKKGKQASNPELVPNPRVLQPGDGLTSATNMTYVSVVPHRRRVPPSEWRSVDVGSFDTGVYCSAPAPAASSYRCSQFVHSTSREVEVRNQRLSELEGEYFGFEGPKNKFSFPDVPLTAGGEPSSRPKFPVPKKRSVDNSRPYDQVAITTDHYDDMDGHGYASINDLSQPRRSLRREIEISDLEGNGQGYEMMSYYDQVCTGSTSGSRRCSADQQRRPSYGYAEVKKISQKSARTTDPSSSLPDLLEDDYMTPRSSANNMSASVDVLAERSNSRKLNTRLGRKLRGDSTHSSGACARYDSPRPSIDSGLLHNNLGRFVLGKSASSLEACARYDSPRPSLDGANIAHQQQVAFLQQHDQSAAHYDTVSGGV